MTSSPTPTRCALRWKTPKRSSSVAWIVERDRTRAVTPRLALRRVAHTRPVSTSLPPVMAKPADLLVAVGRP
jgi:hypothetical protein